MAADLRKEAIDIVARRHVSGSAISELSNSQLLNKLTEEDFDAVAERVAEIADLHEPGGNAFEAASEFLLSRAEGVEA